MVTVEEVVVQVVVVQVVVVQVVVVTQIIVVVPCHGLGIVRMIDQVKKLPR